MLFMNALSAGVSLFITVVLFTLLISYGLGYMVGGKATAEKFVAWELKKLKQLSKRLLKILLGWGEALCRWAKSKL